MENRVFAKPPEVIRIEPSSACNLNCIHCPTGQNYGSDRGIMHRDVFDKILKELSNKKVRVIVLYHGGEPFLNKDIFHMVKELKSWGYPFIKTVTNGMKIEEWMFEKIVISKLDSIEFSLDGSSIEENDSIRVGSDANKVFNNIDRLVYWKKKLHSNTPRIVISNCQIPSEKNINEGEFPKSPEYIIRYVSKYSEGDIFIKLCYALIWPGWKYNTDIYSSMSIYCRKKSYCEQLWEVMTIRYNGDVVPCCYDIMGKCVMGNITKLGIDDIWNGPAFLAFRLAVSKKEYLPMCSDCNKIGNTTFLVRR